MKKYLTVLISTILFFALTPVVFAKASKVHVYVYPEYDKSDVLVMQYVYFNDKKVDATLYLPAEVAENGIRVASPDQKQQNAQTPKSKKEGNYWAVNFPVNTGNGFAEGYYSLKNVNGNKSFDYRFKAPDDADNVYFEFLKPNGAKDFEMTPAPQSEEKNNDKLDVAYYTSKNVKKGQELEFKVSYAKTDAALSVPNKSSQASSDSESNSTSSPNSAAVPVLSALIIILGVAFGLVYYQKNLRSKTPNRAETKTTVTAGTAKFCGNCGTQLPSGAKFCSKCASKA